MRPQLLRIALASSPTTAANTDPPHIDTHRIMVAALAKQQAFFDNSRKRARRLPLKFIIACPPMPVNIRVATPDDAADILEVYAPYCTSSHVSFEIVAP